MPVKPPVYDPPFNILRSSHVALGVADLAASRAFYVDTLGLIVTEETKDRLYLRGTEERNHHSIELRQTGDPLCYALGLKVASEKDLDLAKAWFDKRNLPAEFRETPYAKRTLFARDVRGMPLEFYSKMTTVESALQKYGLHKGARISRIDHLNCFTDDVRLIAARSSSGRCGCTARAMFTTWRSRTGSGRVSITSASGRRRPWTSSIFAT
jgi:catechol 2,3-dioxygenase